MGIYRGPGGTGDAVNDAASEALITVQAKNDALAAQAAAEAAQTAAELAETNAETAEANAETAETNAETAATNAANSASAASTSATNAASSASAASTSASNASTSASNAASSASAASTSASNAAASASTATTQATNASNSASAAATSATNASNSASAAATSATNAANSATAAQTARTAAELAETNAETAETNAETAETNAAASASAAATSASNASTSASNAATSATNASNSASAAATSATNASNSASAAATSATNASNSASAAATSATNAAASYDAFDDRYLGAKSSSPTLDNDGNTLLVGALYYDTTSSSMKVWSGSAWLDAYVSLSGALIATNNLSDLNNTATARTNLGVAIGVNVQAYDADLTTLGAGGSAARSFLGLAIGTDVQAYDAQLADIAGLTPTDNNFIVGNGTNFVTESGSTARTSLGLGSIATQDANNVSITGGSVSGITDLAIADGGTGASDAATARTNLGLGSIATQAASNVAITGGSINGTAIGGSTAAAGTFTSLSDSGNLTFTGTGNRITGDFSNATIANRVMFQNSTTNSGTVISAIPNGTATTSQFVVVNNSDPTNAQLGQLLANTTEFRISAAAYGTGTSGYLPLTMYTGGSERLRIDTSGNVGIGSSATNRLSLTYNGASGEATIGPNSTGGSTFLTLGTSLSGTYGERMRITSGGDVGIGTISPTTTLDARGTVRSTNGTNYVDLVGSEGAIEITRTDGVPFIDFKSGLAEDYDCRIQQVSNGLTFATGGNGAALERMRITSAGGVSFGSSGTAFGTSGQVLVSNGDAAPTWGSSVFRATSVASTSGSAIDFTGIPSWVRKITVLFSGVSLTAAGDVVIQIGDSGGIETTGYVSNAVLISNAGAIGHTSSTTTFPLRDASAAGTVNAHVTISNISGNTWIASGTLNTTQNDETGYSSGRKTLSDVLTQVRITRTGTGTFDAGTVNIMYE